jgi:hypothetical protein
MEAVETRTIASAILVEYQRRALILRWYIELDPCNGIQRTGFNSAFAFSFADYESSAGEEKRALLSVAVFWLS